MKYTSCVTTECHTSLKNKTVVHGPIKANGCYLCHTPVMNTHKFNLAPVPKVCLECHDEIGDQTLFSSHTLKHERIDPKRSCLTCHDPHSSPFPRRLKLKEMHFETSKELCLSCHDKKISSHAHPIPPKELCTQCHSFHYGKIKTPILRFSKNKKESVCIECHREKNIFSNKPPEINACVSCHVTSSLKSVKHIAPLFDHPEIPFPEETKMTCHICHEAHTPAASLKRHYLKRKQPILEVCSICHGEEAPQLYKTFHAIMKRRNAPK
ncbi:MAG: cytochrome c3 family protein [Deltaproteobacteria bacterium]|nr:cytochrome c3 family protein [Deltaproteobacteria bacterium]